MLPLALSIVITVFLSGTLILYLILMATELTTHECERPVRTAKTNRFPNSSFLPFYSTFEMVTTVESIEQCSCVDDNCIGTMWFDVNNANPDLQGSCYRFTDDTGDDVLKIGPAFPDTISTVIINPGFQKGVKHFRPFVGTYLTPKLHTIE